MKRAAETANSREQRIKAKLQEARSRRLRAASFADAARAIAALRRCTTRTRRHAPLRRGSACCAAPRAIQFAGRNPLTPRVAACRPRTSPRSCRRRSRRPSTTATSCRRSMKPRAGMLAAHIAAPAHAKLPWCKSASSRARARSEKRQMEEQVSKLHSENQVRSFLTRIQQECALT